MAGPPRGERVDSSLSRPLGRRWVVTGLAWLAGLGLAGPTDCLPPVSAQNPFDVADPFSGAEGDPFGGATRPRAAATATDDDTTSISHPVAAAIARQDLSQPVKRLAAAETLFLLGFPEQAKQVLTGLPEPLQGREAYDLLIATTSSRLLWLQSQADLPPTVADWLRATLANAMEYSRSDESIDSALDQWLQGNTVQRAAAGTQLQALGLSAGNAILSRMQGLIEAGDLQSPQLRRLVQIIQAGDESWDAALRSATGEAVAVESAAILGLAARTSQALNQVVVLDWTLRDAPNLPDPTLAPVVAFWQTQMLEMHGVDVSNRSLVRRWLETLNRPAMTAGNSDRERQSSGGASDLAMVGEGRAIPSAWLWDADAGGLTEQWASPNDLATRQHVLLATAWLRADPDNPIALRNYVAAQFQRAKQLTGQDQPLSPAVIDAAAQHLSAADMVEMLQQALDRQQWVLSQSLLEAVAEVGGADQLQATSGRPSAVVNALLAADQRVRWAATQTILAWQPRQGFVGSSYLNRVLRELLGSPTGTDVLIASMNPYHAAYLAALTRTIGHEVVVANDAAQLFSEFNDYSPAFLIVTDALGEVPYLSVIDKIRTSPKGQTMPILLVVREENWNAANKMLKVDRRDPWTWVAPFSEAGGDLLPWLEQVSDRQASNALPTRRSIEQVQQALTHLHRWANDDQSRRLLDYAMLAPAAQSVMGLSPVLDAAILPVLANYGNPETQWYLANIAGDAGQSGETRVAAAASFRASVKRFGTLLTAQQIAFQYDRQNSSGSATPLTQSVLNSILDTLEARFRQTPFDELPPIVAQSER